MSKEHDRQLNDAVIKQALNGLPKPVVLTPEQACLERANARMNGVAIKFSALLHASVVRPNYNECIEKMYPIIRMQFADWSKDDLATLACMQMAMTATQALRDNNMI